jgi:predicted nuclease of predicted toxin-antitoxin system
MKILADESVDAQIVERLRQDGHEVDYVAESTPGVTDIEVLNRANELSALLVTADKDFGELVFQQLRAISTGIVLLRLSGISAERKAQTVSEAFEHHGEALAQNFTVVTAGRVRIQPTLS